MIKLALIIIMCSCCLGYSADALQKQPRTITVLGQAKSWLKPNVVQINMGAAYSDTNLSVAMSKTNSAIGSLRQICKSLKVDTNDIQTINLAVNKEYDYLASGRIFKGFLVSNVYALNLRKVNLLDTLIARLALSGINEINSIKFNNDKLDLVRDSLVLVAMADARDKASKRASKAGIKLGLPMIIHAPQTQQDEPIVREFAMAKTMGAGDAMPQVAEGGLTVSVSVEIEYELLE